MLLFEKVKHKPSNENSASGIKESTGKGAAA